MLPRQRPTGAASRWTALVVALTVAACGCGGPAEVDPVATVAPSPEAIGNPHSPTPPPTPVPRAATPEEEAVSEEFMRLKLEYVRAYQSSEYATCLTHLESMLVLIPDLADPRHVYAVERKRRIERLLQATPAKIAD